MEAECKAIDAIAKVAPVAVVPNTHWPGMNMLPNWWSVLYTVQCIPVLMNVEGRGHH